MDIKTLLRNIELEQVVINAIEKYFKEKAKEDLNDKGENLIIKGRRHRLAKFTKEEQKIKKIACDKAYYEKNKERLIKLNTDNYYKRKEKNFLIID
jgi:CO dehydrogenase/acetyl-CoA synthase epsilon subunit